MSACVLLCRIEVVLDGVFNPLTACLGRFSHCRWPVHVCSRVILASANTPPNYIQLKPSAFSLTSSFDLILSFKERSKLLLHSILAYLTMFCICFSRCFLFAGLFVTCCDAQNSTSPRKVGWEPGPPQCGTLTLVWSCIATIITCT